MYDIYIYFYMYFFVCFRDLFKCCEVRLNIFLKELKVIYLKLNRVNRLNNVIQEGSYIYGEICKSNYSIYFDIFNLYFFRKKFVV